MECLLGGISGCKKDGLLLSGSFLAFLKHLQPLSLFWAQSLRGPLLIYSCTDCLTNATQLQDFYKMENLYYFIVKSKAISDCHTKTFRSHRNLKIFWTQIDAD